MNQRIAIIAITKRGTGQARRLAEQMPEAKLYYMSKFAYGDESEKGYHLFDYPVRTLLSQLFYNYTGLICFISLGAVVRLIAPLLQNKRTDPGIVVIDEGAQHVISVLSGHLGGANELARRAAQALGGRLVLTTASDVQGTISVDLLGLSLGWTLEIDQHLTSVSAAVVNEQPVALVQECGSRAWWPQAEKLPSNFRVYRHAQEAVQQGGYEAALVITDRLLTQQEEQRLLHPGVLYRPKTLVLGLGCNRGTKAEELEQVVGEALYEAGLSIRSVRNVATIDLKQDEAGLVELCETYGWPLQTYTAEQLNMIQLRAPSELVYRYTGAYGVCEPAARLSSGARYWLLEKMKRGNVTVSIARIPDSDSEGAP